jgi:hypothetical protein
MNQRIQEYWQAAQAAGWTEEEVAALARALATCRDGLPPRQRDAFTAILTAAEGAIEGGGDMQGYVGPVAGGVAVGVGFVGGYLAVRALRGDLLLPGILKGVIDGSAPH